MWRSLLKAEGCQSKGEKCSFKLWLINNFAFDLLVHEAVILCMDINTSFSFGLFDSIAVHVKVSSEWIDREGKNTRIQWLKVIVWNVKFAARH